MVLQSRVRGANHRVDVGAGIENEYGVDTFLRAIYRANDRRLAHARLLVEHALDVLGKDVEPVRRDDHFLLAALDEQPPLCVPLADITGMQPTFCVEWPLRVGNWELGVVGSWALGVGRCRVITTRDVFPANQDVAIVGDADLDARYRCPDRALTGLEGMIERDDWRGFGETVALDDRESETAPELLHIRRQWRGADDERPELETEGRVHAPVLPPSPWNRNAWRGSLLGFGNRMHDVLAEHVEDLRHAHQHRDATCLDQA